jgi:hypothetical protein
MFRLDVDRENPSLNGIEKLLLRLSLTELPQLWNVLRGEMSLIGPRPESPERAGHYSDWQRQRLSFNPGLTGLAQLHGRRDRHRNVVGIFINQLLRHESMTVFGNDAQQRGFTHIDDVAPVIARSVDCVAAKNQVFNVEADVPYSVNQLAQNVAGAMGVPCNVTHLDPRNEVKIAFSDHSKAENTFGRHEKKSLQEGIGAMAEWVTKHGARKSSVFEGTEAGRNNPQPGFEPRARTCSLARRSAESTVHRFSKSWVRDWHWCLASAGTGEGVLPLR